MTAGAAPVVLVARSAELEEERFAKVNALVEAAFERRFDEIWANIGPGIHVIAEVAGEPVGHAMVVERELHIGEPGLRCGYVENVAAAPTLRGRGVGSVVMRRIAQVIDDDFEIGALATGSRHFYERLGWETWLGPTFAWRDAERLRTAGHDGDVMVLRVAATPPFSGDEPISVAWRRGEVW
ncbi:MAG: GNAT family N-acetyltransferase [Chloroflexota bacterium]